MNAYQPNVAVDDAQIAPGSAHALIAGDNVPHGGGAWPDAARPVEVPGPDGKPMTMADLPSPDTSRWVVRRKAEVIAAIRGGLLTAAEACARYRLSPEELELWAGSLDRAGVPGLRVTRIQLYRDYPPPPRPAPTKVGPHSRDMSRVWER